MRGREIAGLCALVALVVLPVVFGLLQENEYVRTGFEIGTLRKARLTLQERYRRLRIEKATLESFGRIETEARKQGLFPVQEISGLVFSPSPRDPMGAGLGRRSAAQGRPDRIPLASDAGAGIRSRPGGGSREL